MWSCIQLESEDKSAEVGMVISGPTARGAFVSPGISSPANLSPRLPLGPALIVTTVRFDILSDIYFERVCVIFVLMEDLSQIVILRAPFTTDVLISDITTFISNFGCLWHSRASQCPL